MLIPKEKKGAGIITTIVQGIAALVLVVIIAFVMMNTLADANLLGTDTTADNATDDMISNFSVGIGNVSSKIPTVLLIAAIVLILGVLVLLWAQYQRMNLGGGAEL